jgi:D-aminopeptidase
MMTDQAQAPRARIRELGVAPGVLAPGPLNAITDVDGVLVGHVTLIEGDAIRTGVTAILAHAGNLFQERVPAGLAVGNGFGKLMGATQLGELGELETPILLTNTLAVPRAADALLTYTLAQPGNQSVRSVNALVGECNDGHLNDIRRRAVTSDHALAAIARAAGGPVAEGCVGAGTGVVAFGWKGGIGTSSRRLPPHLGGWTVGALAQANYGGVLQIDGLQVGRELGQFYLSDQLDRGDADGSVMIIIATDAPLSDRNLTRVARRALAGLARTGAAISDGSGDYAIALSVADSVRRTPARRGGIAHIEDLANALLSPLFLAAIEATEEAIYNALSMATSMTGMQGRVVDALPHDQIAALHDRMTGTN